MRVALGDSNPKVRLVIMSFRSSSQDVLPVLPPTKEKGRPKGAGGIQLLGPTQGVLVTDFVSDLEAKGYKLVGASSKEDPDPKSSYKMKFTARYVFAHPDAVENEFSKKKFAMATLHSLANQALWKVQVYLNPFLNGGEKPTEDKVVSIDLNSRDPLVFDDGRVNAVWERDAAGEKIGEAAIPISEKAIRLRAEEEISLQ